MIDILLIRNNPDLVREGMRKKQYDPSIVDEVLRFDREWLELTRQVEELRAERNKISKNSTQNSVLRGKEIKEKLKEIEPKLKAVEANRHVALQKIPNLPSQEAPEGKSEENNVEVKKWGDVPKFGFQAKDHLVLGETLDIIDFENAAKVAGSGFYYLKGDGAMLEMALVHYGLDFLRNKGFTPVITPDLARQRYYEGTGYLPKGPEAQTYTVGEDLGLIATAEVTLAGYHADEVLGAHDLPLKYGGYSHCFRMEAGAYGKYSKGLYRVHQFTKVEMFAYARAEDSAQIHEHFLKLEEEFWQSLQIPYRVLEMCTGDLGAQAARKFDLEAWMPGRGDWGEVTSTSNTTDYQARNLNIRYREGSETKYAHTLNGTLVATSRAIIAILENNQQADGSVLVPQVLQEFLGKEKITAKS